MITDPIEFSKSYIGERLRRTEKTIDSYSRHTEKELDLFVVHPGLTYRQYLFELKKELIAWKDLYKHFI